MKQSESHFHDIRGLRYHVRTWGSPDAPTLILLHGWMDVSASFQFLIDAFAREWHVIAPDWRGFGLTAWAREGYWFPDYYADLEELLELVAPQAPLNVVGHSMGGLVACTYAGLRPERFARLVSLEGFGLARTHAEQAPIRYRHWLDGLRQPPRFRPYSSFDEVAARMRRDNPRLTEDKASFLARHWAKEWSDGTVRLRSDPRHKIVSPRLFRLEETIACWRHVTAPVLWVFARNSKRAGYLKDTPEQVDERRSAFRAYREAWLEDCGHMMHHDQPQRLAAIIEEFLSS